MVVYTNRIRVFFYCLSLSILVHVTLLYVSRMMGSYHFGGAVNPPAVTVDLQAAPPAPVATASAPVQETATEEEDEVPTPPAARQNVAMDEPETPAAKPDEPETAPLAASAPVEKELPPAKAMEAEHPAAPAVAAKPDKETAPPAQNVQNLNTANLPAVKQEKLTYSISMLGVPVGSAELESKNDKGLTSITLRVRSNPAFAAIFPVDDVIETSHIDGRFILTKIRQREGAFKSEETITINPSRKRIVWEDVLNSRALRTTVPSSDVLDSLSGIYFLRNRPLEVGKTETLHIFDSETYADVPVEILRREEMRLPNLSKIRTIVVRPLQKTPGIFRRTGDLFIWMTDDENKVPVKIMTSIALGKVTAELVSAETTPHEKQEGKTKH